MCLGQICLDFTNFWLSLLPINKVLIPNLRVEKKENKQKNPLKETLFLSLPQGQLQSNTLLVSPFIAFAMCYPQSLRGAPGVGGQQALVL